MSVLVLQSSWWGRESWLLCLICLSGVSWWLSSFSLRCHGVVCSLWLWYFLIILTYFFCMYVSNLLSLCNIYWNNCRNACLTCMSAYSNRMQTFHLNVLYQNLITYKHYALWKINSKLSFINGNAASTSTLRYKRFKIVFVCYNRLPSQHNPTPWTCCLDSLQASCISCFYSHFHQLFMLSDTTKHHSGVCVQICRQCMVRPY